MNITTTSALAPMLQTTAAAKNQLQIADSKLTKTQKTALSQLHKAANQLEGIFLGMMLKEMRASVPDSSLFGSSPTESTFTEMLDQQRAQAMANSQTLGIGKILETQLKSTVLGNAGIESKVGVPQDNGL